MRRAPTLRQPIHTLRAISLIDLGATTDTGKNGGNGALDQQNNYLRPIYKVVPGADGVIEAQFWID